MNRAQQTHYRTRLWPAACRAQGWAVADEARRRAVTRLVAGGQESTAGLTEDEITALFRHLEHLARPGDLNAALPAANPKDEQEADRRRRATWVIRHRLMPARPAEPPNPPFFKGRPADPTVFSDAYVQACALAFCELEHVATWPELSSLSLGKLIATLTQRRQQKGKNYEPRLTPYGRRESTRAKRRADREPHVAPRSAAAAALAGAQQESLFPF